MVFCNMNHESLRQSKRRALSCFNLCSTEDSAGQAVAWCQTLGLCSGPLAVHALTQCMVEDSPLFRGSNDHRSRGASIVHATTHAPDTFYTALSSYGSAARTTMAVAATGGTMKSTTAIAITIPLLLTL